MPIVLTPSAPSLGDLVSTDRATQNATLAALGTANPSNLAALITAASTAIERVCKRHFTVNSYVEVYTGAGIPYMEIQLSNFPVIEITRVATSPQTVLQVQNTNTSGNQRATIATTSSGLRVTTVASAIKTITDLPFTSYPTITQMATAISALGNGWSVQVTNPYGAYPSADFLPLQGAASAMQGGMVLELYTEDSSMWGASGIWTTPYGYTGNGPGWRLKDSTGILEGVWPQGRQNIRIDYSAGFDPIPSDVQEACVQHVQDLYQAGLVNSSLASEKIGPYSYETRLANFPLSPKVYGLISPYIDHAGTVLNLGPDNS